MILKTNCSTYKNRMWSYDILHHYSKLRLSYSDKIQKKRDFINTTVLHKTIIKHVH